GLARPGARPDDHPLGLVAHGSVLLGVEAGEDARDALGVEVVEEPRLREVALEVALAGEAGGVRVVDRRVAVQGPAAQLVVVRPRAGRSGGLLDRRRRIEVVGVHAEESARPAGGVVRTGPSNAGPARPGLLPTAGVEVHGV